MTARELNGGRPAALERNVDELRSRRVFDEAGQRLVGVLGLAATHLERLGLRLGGLDIALGVVEGRLRVDPEQEFVERHGGDGRQVVRLVGELGDVGQQVFVVGAEGQLVGIAGRHLRVDITLRAAAAALVGDDDRLIHQLVLRDDRLDDRAQSCRCRRRGST